LIHFSAGINLVEVRFSWPGFQALIHLDATEGHQLGRFSWPGFQALIHLLITVSIPYNALAGRDSKP